MSSISEKNMVSEFNFFIFDVYLQLGSDLSIFLVLDMSFLRGIIDSFSSIFTEEQHNHYEESNHDRSVSSNSSSFMNGIDGVPVSNERIAYKLKGYFDLAKEEIAKGVRAEEWGLHDDALLHYRNAQRIMNEANSTPSPSYISSKY